MQCPATKPSCNYCNCFCRLSSGPTRHAGKHKRAGKNACTAEEPFPSPEETPSLTSLQRELEGWGGSKIVWLTNNSTLLHQTHSDRHRRADGSCQLDLLRNSETTATRRCYRCNEPVHVSQHLPLTCVLISQLVSALSQILYPPPGRSFLPSPVHRPCCSCSYPGSACTPYYYCYYSCDSTCRQCPALLAYTATLLQRVDGWPSNPEAMLLLLIAVVDDADVTLTACNCLRQPETWLPQLP